MRSRCAVKKADLTRATKALLAAGLKIARVELDPLTGKFAIIVSDGDDDASGLSSSKEDLKDLV